MDGEWENKNHTWLSKYLSINQLLKLQFQRIQKIRKSVIVFVLKSKNLLHKLKWSFLIVRVRVVGIILEEQK